jgi:sialic acid synthase SpsE
VRSFHNLRQKFEERILHLPFYFIAELGLNHNGSTERAHELIDIAAGCGAHAIKLQKRTVDQLAIQSVLDARDGRFPSLGSTYREVREAHEFSFEDFTKLRDHTESLGLDFFVTPFDKIAVDFLAPLNLVAIKVASHSVTNIPLISYIAAQNKFIIMSTGMSTLEEVDLAVDLFKRANASLVLMHCVSSYPTHDSDLNLRIIPELSKRYDLPVGYSGHEINSNASMIALALGGRIIERHITQSRHLEGFDHKLSLDPDDLKSLISDLEQTHTMLGSSEKRLQTSEMKARNNYNVSMVAKRDIKTGEKLLDEMIEWKNPGTGIPPKRVQEFLGRTVTRYISADSLLAEEDFE